MAFQYLTNVALDKARDEYIALLKENGFAPRTETIPVERSCGRITAKAVYAAICAPHYPASAMDGIAIAAADSFGAGEGSPVTLDETQFTVVDTGDPIPDGCDAVVMIEDVVRQSDGKVKLFAPAAPWQHIRQIGEDICAGEMILASHCRISPAAIGSMLAGGVLQVEVICPMVVGLIPTGDEIVPPTDNPKAGDIIEFNSSIFSAMLKEWGAESICFPIVPDKKELLSAALKEAVACCDAVVLNAGSSAGREDFSAAVIGEQGGVLYHGLAGVPGYPVSGIIVMEELMKPWWTSGSAAAAVRHSMPKPFCPAPLSAV